MARAYTGNLGAFLDMLALSEGTAQISDSDDGYRVLVGSTPAHHITFVDYSTHPDILNRALNSTAAGRYQIICPTFKSLCLKYGYKDFTPETQDKMAISLIAECEAIEDVYNGNVTDAITKCANTWASLPGGSSGQHENQMSLLIQYFTSAGGKVV